MSVEQKLCGLVCEVAGVSKGRRFAADERMLEDLGVDSLDLVELAMHVEDEFNIEVPDGDEKTWNTFGDLVSYVEARN